MKRAAVSIIIPVYNGEHYIERCLNTVINQTLKNIEIIIVNDGSFDGTKRIIDNYCKRDKRIMIINKHNEGLYKARLDGIKYSSGEYIGFVDSDDKVELEMFEKMYQVASKGNYDVVNCNYYIEDENGKCSINNFTQLELHSKDEILYNYFSKHLIKEMMWSKIIKKEVFNDYEYIKNISTAEDYLIFSKILINIKSLYNLNEPLYYYFQRSDSIMNSKFSDKKINRLYSGEEVRDYYKKEMPDYINFCSLNLCFIIIYIYADIEKKEHKEKYYNDLKRKYHLYYKESKKVQDNISFLKKMLLLGFNFFPNAFSFIYKKYIKKRRIK